MSDDLVKRLRNKGSMSHAEVWETFKEAADRIEELEAENKLHAESATIIHFQGVMYARDSMADAIWEAHKHWEGEKKFALREVVKFLRGGKDEQLALPDHAAHGR